MKPNHQTDSNRRDANSGYSGGGYSRGGQIVLTDANQPSVNSPAVDLPAVDLPAVDLPAVDLNADVGEGVGSDDALMAWVTSVNVACGGHIGDDDSVRVAIGSAARRGVAAGAHPSYPDRSGFGRRSIAIAPDRLRRRLDEQLERFVRIANQLGVGMTHCKPHGALYHDAAADPAVARILIDAIIAACVGRMNPAGGGNPHVVGPPDGYLRDAANHAGLVYVAEGFIDRGYGDDGRLLPRNQPGGILSTRSRQIGQAVQLVLGKHVVSCFGKKVPINVQTICIHGDHADAVNAARQVHRRLADAGVTIGSPVHSSVSTAASVETRSEHTRVYQASDDVLCVRVGDVRRTHAVAKRLRTDDAWVDIVPGMTEVAAVLADPQSDANDANDAIDVSDAIDRMSRVVGAVDTTDPVPPRTIRLRVRYGGDDGPDLNRLCESLGISPDTFIHMHTDGEHAVDMIGFTPGFAYIGGLDRRFAIERLPTPRSSVPAGSVAVTTGCTGIYAMAGPGGWPIIGRTDHVMFDANRDDPFTLVAGDRVRFVVAE